jgi:hypothetical protein
LELYSITLYVIKVLNISLDSQKTEFHRDSLEERTCCELCYDVVGTCCELCYDVVGTCCKLYYDVVGTCCGLYYDVVGTCCGLSFDVIGIS